MYVAVLTESGAVYVFSFELVRLDNWREIQRAQKNDTLVGEYGLDENGGERIASLTDYPYHSKYKQMLQQYEYRPKYFDHKKVTQNKKKRKG